ncbi:MAG: hypothetical protein B9S32_01750 [Verrucomicrobia bacterium Tous-C9LFEB]|nr:MAG: hypothetical protein B9S32_01750 [Verrucomicrobia bacterium Tous-C9LFEB]
MEDLTEAVESGDLEAAKTALAAIQKDMASKSASASTSSDGSSTNSDNPMAKDFQALSDAIESGDLDAAKSALDTIKTNMAKGGQRPPPPPEESDSTEESDTISFTLNLSSSKDSTESTDSTTSTQTTFETTLDQLIAYLADGSATTNNQAGSQYKAQA